MPVGKPALLKGWTVRSVCPTETRTGVISGASAERAGTLTLLKEKKEREGLKPSPTLNGKECADSEIGTLAGGSRTAATERKMEITLR